MRPGLGKGTCEHSQSFARLPRPSTGPNAAIFLYLALAASVLALKKLIGENVQTIKGYLELEENVWLSCGSHLQIWSPGTRTTCLNEVASGWVGRGVEKAKHRNI